MSPMYSRSLQFLVVGDEDVSRAPATKLLLGRALTPHAAVDVSSAGVVAPAGFAVAPNVDKRLSEMGVSGAGHRSRLLGQQMITESHLILAATRAQASAVLIRDPSVLERTFTLQGLARLVQALSETVGGHPVGGSAGWLARVIAGRGRVTQLHSPEDDLAPLTSVDRRATAQGLELIDTACRTIARSYRS